MNKAQQRKLFGKKSRSIDLPRGNSCKKTEIKIKYQNYAVISNIMK